MPDDKLLPRAEIRQWLYSDRITLRRMMVNRLSATMRLQNAINALRRTLTERCRDQIDKFVGEYQRGLPAGSLFASMVGIETGSEGEINKNDRNDAVRIASWSAGVPGGHV